MELKNDHDTYETIWPLYLYYTHLKQEEKASKFLRMAYENVGNKLIEQYHEHSNKNLHPRFFWCKNIIEAYESSLNQ